MSWNAAKISILCFLPFHLGRIVLSFTRMPGIVYKKVLAVMLAFMALFLTACGEKQEERSKLIMVTNATFPPYEF